MASFKKAPPASLPSDMYAGLEAMMGGKASLRNVAKMFTKNYMFYKAEVGGAAANQFFLQKGHRLGDVEAPAFIKQMEAAIQELGDGESNTVIRRRGVLRELIKLAEDKTKYPDWPFKREVGMVVASAPAAPPVNSQKKPIEVKKPAPAAPSENSERRFKQYVARLQHLLDTNTPATDGDIMQFYGVFKRPTKAQPEFDSPRYEEAKQLWKRVMARDKFELQPRKLGRKRNGASGGAGGEGGDKKKAK